VGAAAIGWIGGGALLAAGMGAAAVVPAGLEVSAPHCGQNFTVPVI
jgi:hypothetical protein